ncbi:hypothetical protein M9Y10_015561 [Tritrichomonas musculus]|mgnify:CR=1 FL=1|uniref:Uncharacterized protein n=1 Tax=Tritrichomonas musculus TaxID=1915356 RepID=A0ABR2L3N7_9EUKA
MSGRNRRQEKYYIPPPRYGGPGFGGLPPPPPGYGGPGYGGQPPPPPGMYGPSPPGMYDGNGSYGRPGGRRTYYARQACCSIC